MNSAPADHLHVLNDLARRLASMHESQGVLQEVASQARRLLAVDVAYIMLLTERRILRIEYVDGSMGAALRGIELEPGLGLGGRVLETGEPLWSESYLTDDRFPHKRSIDQAASSEQLGGILGVPLVVTHGTIGVLLVADRRERKFATDEIQLLAALASHAAAAIRNASLFEQQEAAARDLRATNEELRAAHAARQRAAQLQESLTATMLANGGLPALVAELARNLGGRVALLDVSGELLAGEAVPAGHRLTAEVALPNGPFGTLVAVGSSLPGEEVLRYLAIGATSVALVAASQRSILEAELRIRGEFVSALLSPDLDDASVRRRGRATGIDVDAVRVVAVIDPPDGGAAEALQVARRLADELHGWSAGHDQRIVLLVPATDAATVRARLVALSGDLLPGAVGLATTSGGVADLRKSYDAARRTATVLQALSRTRHCAVASDLGPYRLLFGSAGRAELESYVLATIGPLLQQGSERQRELVRTLEAYLDLAQHHARTCALLHIHTNTLYQRLDRLTSLLGADWRDSPRALDIHLALRLHRLARELEK